jgi:6-phosphogluconolactonase
MSTHRRRLLSILLVGTLASCGGGATSSSGGSSKTEILYAAYVTPNGGGSGGHIIPMRVDSSGNLTPLTSVLGPGNAVTVFADPSGKFLYASDFNTGVVWAYAIDPKTGNLTNLSGSPYNTPFGGNGGAMAMDPGGKFIFYVRNASGLILTFTRNTSDGTLTPSTSGLIPIDSNQPISLAVDVSGKFLYAADHSDPSGSEISVFAIDSTTGALTQLPSSPYTFQANSEPWGMALSSNGQFLFTALWNAGSVEVLSVDGSTGAVIPNSNTASMALPQQLILHPSGKFLYTANINPGSIGAFSVTSATGALNPISGSPYPSVSPVALAIDPSGKYFFFSTTFPTNQIAVWKIDQTTGALAPGTTFPSPNGIYPPTALAAITLP